jgi:ADP-ribose 1''-phosphate phosphatase
MITYKKMSLFDAPKDSAIIHACNSMGVWGSGIAKEFKTRYPHSYKEYLDTCTIFNGETGSAAGTASMSSAHVDEVHWVGWIITSHNYGPKRDSIAEIKVHTTLALQSLCHKLYKAHPNYEGDNPLFDVYSNKFNSGLFAVPWEDSELILNTVLKRFKRINWIVCDPNIV